MTSSEASSVPRPIQLTLGGARALHLAAQGVLKRPNRPATKYDVLAAIRRMGALQIDSISVVARSPYLVLWSRLGAYDSAWLDELLARGKLFEYWSHANCFLPIEDWPLYRGSMLNGFPDWRVWLEGNLEVVDRVRERLREGGPVRSSEWERADGKKGSGWWDWKPEKLALECMFRAGEVMIARRENFQRVYDLRERVLPSWDDRALPAEEDVRRELVLRAVRALGVAKPRWVREYFKHRLAGAAPKLPSLLESLVDEGLLLRAEIEGWKTSSYIHADNAALARRAARRPGRGGPSLRHEGTTLLSPFDPVVRDRARLLELWGFRYQIEVYTPAAKRRYGYFTLPILHRGRIVGRLDPKAHRGEGLLKIRQIHLEPGIEPSEDLVEGLAGALKDFASWQNLGCVEIGVSDPPELAASLRERL